MKFKGPLLIILYGGPGSGKSTQAQLLSQALGAPYLNMGESLRQLSRQKTPLAREVKRLISQGKLASLKVSQGMVASFIRRHKKSPRLVFDGYPRNLSQGRAFRALAQKGRGKILFLFLVLSKSAASERLIKRAKLTSRVDDLNPQALKKRFVIFQREAKKMLSFFRRELRRVQGEGNRAAVGQRILRVVRNYGD